MSERNARGNVSVAMKKIIKIVEYAKERERERVCVREIDRKMEEIFPLIISVLILSKTLQQKYLF
jgi:hypothetical protein